MRIPLAKPWFGPEEEAAVAEVLRSGWVASGPKTEEFEKAFAARVGRKYAVAVNSWTSGMHLVLLALDIKPGDEVIIPDFTFPATGNVVLHSGARAVVADVDDRTFNMTPDTVRDLITRKTRAIMPVHAFGCPARVDEFEEICKEKDILLLEDAACGIGSARKGRPVGSFGKASVFSLHARKVLTTGEGGMVCTDDEILARKVASLRNHGASAGAWALKNGSLPEFEVPGYNFRLTDIQAAIGLVQLRKLDAHLERRFLITGWYNEMLCRVDPEAKHFQEQMVEDPFPNQDIHSYQSFVLQSLDGSGHRDSILKALRAAGIGCGIGTYSLTSTPLFTGSCPNGRLLFRTTISLPMHATITKDDIARVGEVLAG